MTPDTLLSLRIATDAALTVLVEGTLLLGVAWAVAAIAGPRAPAVRHAAWTAGFVLALLLPLGGLLVPQRSLGLLHYPRALVGWPSTSASPAADLAAAAPFPGLPAAATRGGTEGGPSGFAGRARISQRERIAGSLTSTFLLLWSVGALILLARLLRHRIRVAGLTGRGSPGPPDDAPVRLAVTEAHRMGIQRRVRVVYTPELPVPVTWGVLRPFLLLPPEAASWPPARLRAVIVHELAHVRRWDALSQQLGELVRAMYWANPLAWAARRLAVRDRERACDQEVLRSGMAPSAYAGVLVDMARRSAAGLAELTPELEGGLALAGPSGLDARVAAVLERRGEVRGSGRRSAGAAWLVLGVAAAPLAGTSPMTDAPEPVPGAPPVVERLRTVRALGLECDEASLWELARALQEDPAPGVRTAVARTLGVRADPGSVHVLAHAAADARQDPLVRQAAVRALGGRDTGAAADALVARLRSDDPELRRATVRAMARLQRHAARVRGPVALLMLKDPDSSVRAAAARTLARVGAGDSVPWLLEALDDPSAEVAHEAGRTLRRLGAL